MRKAIVLLGILLATPIASAQLFGEYYEIPGLSDITPVVVSYEIDGKHHFIVTSHTAAYRGAKLRRIAEQAIRENEQSMQEFYKGLREAGIPVVKTQKEADELMKRAQNARIE